MNIWMNEIWIQLDILLLFNFLTGAAAYLIWRLTVRLWKDRRSSGICTGDCRGYFSVSACRPLIR